MKNESHNVYSGKDQYRIRLYRNDKKLMDKQIHTPKLHFYSFGQLAITILSQFADKIAEENNQKDKFEFYNDEMLEALNKAFLISNLIKTFKE